MNLRDFLGQREKELIEQIAELHSKMAPLETDLAVYREAKAVVNRPIKEFAVGDSTCGDALAEYPPPSSASTALRQFLDHHEEDLTAQINGVRVELMPLEAELAEVRRAKAAIGLRANAPPNQGLVDALVGFGRIAMALTDAQRRAGKILEAEQAKYEMPVMLPAPSPYSNLTMKQLVVKVLSEHFHNGATTRQMVDFFRDAWGRDIARTNLSPQISRLYNEGIVGHVEDTNEWYLIPEDSRGKKPYRVITRAVHGNETYPTGEIEWLLPQDVTEYHELVGQPITDSNPDADEN